MLQRFPVVALLLALLVWVGLKIEKLIVIEFGLEVSTTSTLKVQVSKLSLPSVAFAVTVCCALENVSAPDRVIEAWNLHVAPQKARHQVRHAGAGRPPDAGSHRLAQQGVQAGRGRRLRKLPVGIFQQGHSGDDPEAVVRVFPFTQAGGDVLGHGVSRRALQAVQDPFPCPALAESSMHRGAGELEARDPIAPGEPGETGQVVQESRVGRPGHQQQAEVGLDQQAAR